MKSFYAMSAQELYSWLDNNEYAARSEKSCAYIECKECEAMYCEVRKCYDALDNAEIDF